MMIYIVIFCIFWSFVISASLSDNSYSRKEIEEIRHYLKMSDVPSKPRKPRKTWKQIRQETAAEEWRKKQIQMAKDQEELDNSPGTKIFLVCYAVFCVYVFAAAAMS